jgi:hypothetical protein
MCGQQRWRSGRRSAFCDSKPELCFWDPDLRERLATDPSTSAIVGRTGPANAGDRDEICEPPPPWIASVGPGVLRAAVCRAVDLDTNSAVTAVYGSSLAMSHDVAPLVWIGHTVAVGCPSSAGGWDQIGETCPETALALPDRMGSCTRSRRRCCRRCGARAKRLRIQLAHRCRVGVAITERDSHLEQRVAEPEPKRRTGIRDVAVAVAHFVPGDEEHRGHVRLHQGPDGVEEGRDR